MVESIENRKEVKEYLQIDGSMLEGGGQVIKCYVLVMKQLLRVSLGLSYILKQPIYIEKIRANRGKGGGLGNQHLTGVRLNIYLNDLA